MLLGAEDRRLDLQGAYELVAGSCEISLGLQHPGQLVQRGGDVRVLLGAEDRRLDLQGAYELLPRARKIALCLKHTGQIVKRYGDGRGVFTDTFNMS